MNKKIKLYLLRHAESQANEMRIISCKLPGTGLSLKGMEQARHIGKNLAEIKKIKKIYCSPFQRAVATLSCVDFSEKLILDARIKELDYGDFDFRPQQDVEMEIIKTLEKISNGDYDARFGKTGENQREFINRVYGFLIEVIKNDEPALAVTHECVISAIHRFYRKIRNLDKKIKVENCQIIDLEFEPQDISTLQDELRRYGGQIT